MNSICRKTYTKKKDHSLKKNAFVHHCLLNLMLYDWELLGLSDLCPPLLHCMTFYHTASFRQVLIISCSVVIQYCGMGYGLFRSRWITCRQIWGFFFPLWMFTGTKLYIYNVYILLCTTNCSLQDERHVGFKLKKNYCGSFVVINFSCFFFSSWSFAYMFWGHSETALGCKI